MADANFKPTDLLGIKIVKNKENEDIITKANFSLVHGISVYFSDFWAMMNFKSTIVEDYFIEITHRHSRKHLRKVLKYCLLYMFNLILLYPILYPGNVDKFKSCFGFATMIYGYYFLTLLKFDAVYYETFSMICFWSVFLLDTYANSDLVKAREINYSAISNIIFYIIAILQVNVNVTVIITLFYIAILRSFTYFRLTIISNVTEYHTSDNTPQFLHYTIINPQKNALRAQKFTESQVILYMLCLLSGLYLHCSNLVRRKLSFLRLGSNVKSQRQVKTAYRNQVKFIETIMPAVIKKQYWAERKTNMNENMWVFCKCFDDVSILFADIVGFTNMSSNKTAPQVVTLLNDLFNRFDMLCDLTRCEKLGTLGDCYYCVSGCPLTRSDHAMSCIEMGLGMCRIIKHFNNDYKESVNMRVGVHTGRVNAAIIGNTRFRFDVYSNDVLIANLMESSGEPGRVHISETTYESAKEHFRFEKGETLQIKKEIKSGIAGLKLTVVNIETYFVVAKSSSLRKATKHIEKGKERAQNIIHGEDNEENIKSGSEEVKSGVTNIEIDTGKEASIDNTNQAFVQALRKDPNKLINLFNFLPVFPTTLRFLDPTIENKFLSHTRFEVNPVYIDSVKLSALVDSIACVIFFSFIILAISILFPNAFVKYAISFVFMYFVAITIVCILWWNTVNLAPLFQQETLRKLFLITSHPCTINCMSFILCSLPMWAVYMVYDCRKLILDHLYTASFFILTYFSGISYAIFVTSFWWVNATGAFLHYGLFSTLFLFGTICIEDRGYDNSLCDIGRCQGPYKKYRGQYWPGYIFAILFEYIQIFYCVVIMNRENEKNLRLCFYVTREAQIRSEAAHKAMLETEEILHNIIPEYALKTIKLRAGSLSKKDFSYAENIANAAVIFACISNFFSSYYREDYKGGEGALKMLNKIICLFDDALRQSKYNDVDKIKSINDCYMAASGLNVTKKHKDSKRHLKALMKYCFEMYIILQDFNDQYVINDKFEMKIGYNIGPVTAGVIGTTKPLYDIWGDTVNVASRMYSTATSGIIQAPEKVKNALEAYFHFTYRDKVVVKGKGEMETYIVTEKNEKHN